MSTEGSWGASVAALPQPVPTIQELEAEVDRLRRELGEAQRALTEARVEAAPFAVGDVVLAPRRLNGARSFARAIVREIDAKGWATWYSVSFERRDGTWADKHTRVYSDVKSLGEGVPDRADLKSSGLAASPETDEA